MQILLIRRAECFSPHHEANDRAIIDAVGQRLAEAGHAVTSVAEDEWPKMTDAEVCSFDVVFHMTRRLRSLMRLERLSDAMHVVNPAHAVRQVATSRELTLSLLHEGGVAVPPWWAYDPEADEMFQCEEHLQALLPGWVKAMRPNGAHPDDVRFVQTPLEADVAVIELAAEAVPDIVVTRHCPGDLLKCYAVADPRGEVWTHSFYPQEQGYSKFGEAEQHNSSLQHMPLAAGEVERVAGLVARIFGLQVFGFDAIVQPDGTLVVIDVNDWPSFAVCRDEAADHIAALLHP